MFTIFWTNIVIGVSDSYSQSERWYHSSPILCPRDLSAYINFLRMPLSATWIGSALCLLTIWRQLLPLLRRPLLLRSLLRLFHVLLRSQLHHWWPPLAIVALPCRGVWRPRWDLFFSRSPEYHPLKLYLNFPQASSRHPTILATIQTTWSKHKRYK